MTLSLPSLKESFGKLMNPDNPSFVGFPADISSCASNFADAYESYCLSATDLFGNKLLTTNKPGFISAFIAGMVPPPGGNAITAAAAFEAAAIAFWTGATFEIVTPPPGFASVVTNIVVLVVPAALSTPLAVQFGTIISDGTVVADAIAQIFHTWTTTSVITTITGVTPSTPPVPIVLTSLIL